MYLLGASGHAKVILEILETAQITVDGLFDDNPAILRMWNYTVNRYPGHFNPSKDELIISIGSNAIRKRLAEKLGVNYGKALHPASTISPRAMLGAGTVVMAGVTINADVVIGEHVIVNTNASVDHDCTLEDYVHISPNATLCGNVCLGEGTHVGAGAVIIPGITVGKWAVIGAGSVVIRDVPDGATVVGNPGRIIREAVIR